MRRMGYWKKEEEKIVRGEGIDQRRNEEEYWDEVGEERRRRGWNRI